MYPLKSMLCIIAFLLHAGNLCAQTNLTSVIINTDVIYDTEAIPMVGIEKFFIKNGQLRSWHIDAGYQIHYNNEMGILNDGDDISVGVYQGPGIKLGYSYCTKWLDRKWKNYFSPTLGIKYLWYDPITVFTGGALLNNAQRIQSEKCLSLVPQFYVGQKRIRKSFCYDYYFGLQVPVKFREKNILYEENSAGVANSKVPYTSYVITPTINIVFGIKLGYVLDKRLQQEVIDNDPDSGGD